MKLQGTEMSEKGYETGMGGKGRGEKFRQLGVGGREKQKGLGFGHSLKFYNFHPKGRPLKLTHMESLPFSFRNPLVPQSVHFAHNSPSPSPLLLRQVLFL